MKEKQRIAILIDRLNIGGVEKIAIEQVKALRAIGEDATLVVLSRKAVVENAFADLRRGVPTIYLDDRLPGILKFTFRFPVFSFFSLFHITYPFLIPFTLKKDEFDYFIVHGTYTGFTAVTMRIIKKIPYSIFIWDPIGYILRLVYGQKFPKILLFLLFHISQLFDGTIIKNADVILVGGEAHNTYLRTFSQTKPIIEIRPSVYAAKKLNVKKEKYILLATAWKRGKHPEYIYQIVKKIPKLKFVMAGGWVEEDYKKEFERFCKEKRINNNVKILGAVSEAELSKLYKHALCLLQINDTRGFGMPALEAAGQGTTFVIPEKQGVCRLFTDEKDGFFTKEEDTKSIAACIQKLIRDPLLAMKMGAHAWETVEKKYTWKSHAYQLKEVILTYSSKR